MKLSTSEKYPNGQLSEDDEGVVGVAVRVDCQQGVVLVEFQQPLRWFAMRPDDALELSAAIIKHAKLLVGAKKRS